MTGCAISRSIDGAPGQCGIPTAVHLCGVASASAPPIRLTVSSVGARMAPVTRTIGQLRARQDAHATATPTPTRGIDKFQVYSIGGLASVSIPASSPAQHAGVLKYDVHRKIWPRTIYEIRTLTCKRQACWMRCSSPCQTQGWRQGKQGRQTSAAKPAMKDKTAKHPHHHQHHKPQPQVNLKRNG